MNRILTILATIFIGSSSMATTPEVGTKNAMFAGGCFWCMQPSFDNAMGVVATSVGYSGGTKETATYEQVSSGTTGHAEVIQVMYDPSKIAYEKLLETYLENIDPTDAQGQFADKGKHYQTAIYYADDAQKLAAEKALAAIAPKFAPKPIVVKILPTTPFFAAEEYHQKYYQKNSADYDAYKKGSGRAGYIEKVWGK